MTDPLISVTLANNQKIFSPGDEFVCEYQIDAVEASEILAIEASVLWHTQGKGEEDLGVHFFERRVPTDAEEGDLRPMRRFRTRLPNSPLSYHGAICSVRWCVRIRLFLRRGRELYYDYPFQMGLVPAAIVVAPLGE